MQGDRAPRGELARLRCKGDRLATSSLTDPSQARVRRKVPGFLFLCAPLAESAHAHASEACSSGFESRVGYQIFLRARMRSRLLFYNLDVAKTPRRARAGSIDRAAGLRGFPSSNGEDGGLSSRQCRFNSGRERQYLISL